MELTNGCAYKYTSSEIKDLLNSLEVLVDTREKKNKHITDYLDEKGVGYEERKLDVADYSVKIPADEKLGFQRPVYFDDVVAIERKSGCNELAQNFSSDRHRFENELLRSSGMKIIVVVEQAGGYGDILNGKYRSEFNPKSFVGTMHTFRHRYDADFDFVAKSYVGNYIYYSLYYWLREWLK